MARVNKKRALIIFTIFLIALLIITIATKTSSKPSKDIIEDGVIINKLVILGSGNKTEIEEAVKKYQGEITLEVKETQTYEAKFPVDSLDELNEIKDGLNTMGIKAVNDYAIDLDKLDPAGPQ